MINNISVSLFITHFEKCSNKTRIVGQSCLKNEKLRMNLYRIYYVINMISYITKKETSSLAESK